MHLSQPNYFGFLKIGPLRLLESLCESSDQINLGHRLPLIRLRAPKLKEPKKKEGGEKDSEKITSSPKYYRRPSKETLTTRFPSIHIMCLTPLPNRTLAHREHGKESTFLPVFDMRAMKTSAG